MAVQSYIPHVFWEEKISIEPDLGDQRQSTYKALPSPPKTPKRILMKYRLSGALPLIMSLTAFVLTLVVVLAGQHVGTFEGQYLMALNTSRVGHGVIAIEEVSTLSAKSPIASWAPSEALDSLRSRSTSRLSDVLDDLSANLTNAVDEVFDQAGIKDLYYVYLQRICSGSSSSRDDSTAKGIQMDDCRSWENATEVVDRLSRSIPSFVVVGQSKVSIPLIAKLTSSLNCTIGNVEAFRRTVFAFLIITLAGSSLSAVSMVPAMQFPQSRLLIYLNVMWSALTVASSLVAAVLVSIIAVVGRAVDGISETVGVQVEQGRRVLLLVWLVYVCVSLVTLYWASVWFVETRDWSAVKRRREEDEMGHWGGIGKEVWRDVQGRRRTLRMRGDM